MFRSFRGTIYAKTTKGLLIYDSESFRPVEAIAWNPATRKVEPVYGALCHELFDANYGYGTPEMQAYCEKLEVDESSVKIIENPDEFWRWTEQPLEWLKDRPVVLHPCVKAMGRADYLRILGLRAKTLKRMPRQIRGTIKQRRR
jgi:hypothetical protein